jgi:hypothetical protein
VFFSRLERPREFPELLNWRREANPDPTVSVRGDTGRWLQMRVLYVEDLANHDDPESCGDIRKDVGKR